MEEQELDLDLYTEDGLHKYYLKKKIIILGEGGVGKTTLLYRYIHNHFYDSTKMTIGSNFFVKRLVKRRENGVYNITLLLWDFAGQERFRFILKNYVKGVEAIILSFDLSRFVTLEALRNWIEMLKERNAWDQPHINYYLIGTKKDLIDEDFPIIAKETIENFIQEYKFPYYIETSSLTGEGVNELFDAIAEDMVNKERNLKKD